MKIAFRADASIPIGSGHVMRCLTLADRLQERGARVLFVCRGHEGNLVSFVEGKGYRVAKLPQPGAPYRPAAGDVAQAAWLGVAWREDAEETSRALQGERMDWLVVDHYGIDRRWHKKLRPHAERIMVIDDIADRPHDCEILLDQNLYRDMDARYRDLVPENCRKLLGPAYALLRPEFAQARQALRDRSGEIARVLVFFGGVDPTNETMKALQALSLFPKLAVDAVVGAANPFKDRIRLFCSERTGYRYHCQIGNMAQLMGEADLVVGAGGSATWERCFLGLPSITLTNAENQVETTTAVAAAGATLFLGRCSDVDSHDISAALGSLLRDPVLVRGMGKKSIEIMGDSPSGGAPLICELINRGMR